MYIIQASKKNKRAISSFQSLFGIIHALMGSIWFANELESRYQDYTYICHFQKKIITLPTRFSITDIHCQMFHSYDGT